MGIYTQFMGGRESLSLKLRPSLNQPWEPQFPPVGRADDSPCVHLSVGLTAVGFMAINSASISTLLSSLATVFLQSATSGLLCPSNAPCSPAPPQPPSPLCSFWSCLVAPDAIALPPGGGATGMCWTLQGSPAWPVKADTEAAHQCLPLRCVLWS